MADAQQLITTYPPTGGYAVSREVMSKVMSLLEHSQYPERFGEIELNKTRTDADEFSYSIRKGVYQMTLKAHIRRNNVVLGGMIIKVSEDYPDSELDRTLRGKYKGDLYDIRMGMSADIEDVKKIFEGPLRTLLTIEPPSRQAGGSGQPLRL